MYRIITTYNDGRIEVFDIADYSRACALVDEIVVSQDNVKKVALVEE